MFLTPEDYKPYIRAAIKDDILLGQTAIIQQVEMAAKQEISSYLSGRYDVSKVFPTILTYDAGKTYAIGDYVYDINAGIGKIFRSVISNSDVKPSTGTVEQWVEEDPRNPIIVLRMVYITLYHGHKALPSSQIPQLRVDDYDISIKWLEKVAAGLLNPLLPEAVTLDNNIASWGSETRRQNRY